MVLDAIGVQGARVRFLDKVDDAQWAEQLKWRSPNLMIYEFGANESGDNFAYPMKDYHRTLKAVLEQGRKAVPEAGCLVLAAMDRAEKNGDRAPDHARHPRPGEGAEVGLGRGRLRVLEHVQGDGRLRLDGEPGSSAAWARPISPTPPAAARKCWAAGSTGR